MQAAGFVLVGGRSSRMGCDKALLRWNSHALVEEVAARVRNVAGNVVLVGRPERYRVLGFECLADLRSGLGPLAGVEAALIARRAELNLIVACDMPGIRTEWLRQLLLQAEQNDALSNVVRDADGTVHPLCAVYRSGCLAAVRRALDERRLKLQDLLNELRTAFYDIHGSLQNVNTREEWMALQETGAHIDGR